ncbi:CHAD domain-containing protein [Photobacterium lipolyticum]|uniref:Adenylate cyclase n=1 Tax=Photobacterium lipolyticum TaxID=266810 RepID=A0A2T3N2Y7_9GAMM|nr:CHAD domain-containing protein [Photobacterium lipolyticum]PSW06701.1 adenylate cyclase [Photobacterium lipolyticum]
MNVTKRDKLKFPKRKKDKINLDAKTDIYLPTYSFLITEFHYARQHEAGLLRDDDDEFLHQYRVSLRRSRAIISLLNGLFQPEQSEMLAITLKRMMQKTNLLRDLDVYLHKMDDYYGWLEHKHHQGLARFFDDMQNKRSKAFKELKQWMKTDNYKQQCKQVNELIERLSQAPTEAGQICCQQFGPKVIWKRAQKVLMLSRAISTDSPDSKFHQLRIECKKLRYLLEFFLPLFPAKQVKKQITTLKQLQDLLGEFNDSSIQQLFLAGYLATRKPNSHPYLAVERLLAITEKQQITAKNQIIQQLIDFADQQNIDSYQSLYR